MANIENLKKGVLLTDYNTSNELAEQLNQFDIPLDVKYACVYRQGRLDGKSDEKARQERNRQQREAHYQKKFVDVKKQEVDNEPNNQ